MKARKQGERKIKSGRGTKWSTKETLSIDENDRSGKTKRAEECKAECEHTSMAIVIVGKILEPVAMPTRVGLQHLMHLSTEGLKSDE